MMSEKWMVVAAVGCAFVSVYNFTWKTRSGYFGIDVTYRRPGLGWAFAFVSLVLASYAFLTWGSR